MSEPLKTNMEAREIMVDAVETMAWTGEVPWHGLGVEIGADDPALRDMPAFMEKAELDWEVQKVSLMYGDDHPFTPGQYIENEFHLIRSNDGAQLSVHPITDDGYNVRDNASAVDVLQPFLDSGEFTLETAGSLFSGRKVWFLCRLGTGFDVGHEDQVVNFLTYTIDHSGINANTAFYTPIRVVCANTLRLATSSAGDMVRDNHRTPFDADLMRVALDLVRKQSVDYETLCKDMMAFRVSGEQVVEYFRTVYKQQPKPDDAGRLIDGKSVRRAVALYHGTDPRNEKQEPARVMQRRNQEVINAMRRGAEEEANRLLHQIDEPSNVNGVNPGWEKAEGTLWGAYNVVSYVVDHSPMRSYASDDHRLDRALYSSQNDIKNRATIAAAELVA
jgi:phage/plasmid-like protein (TIGR03299 family)